MTQAQIRGVEIANDTTSPHGRINRLATSASPLDGPAEPCAGLAILAAQPFAWQPGAAAVAMTIAIMVATIVTLCEGGKNSRAFAIGVMVPNAILFVMVFMRIVYHFTDGEGYMAAVRWYSLEQEAIAFANQRKVFAIAWGLSLVMGLFAVAFRWLIGGTTNGDSQP
ncbi:MAG TPA: hypothetical protein VG125_21855 [Pirellulales bacterium]|jgi:hypothetical protein|nr:hypothetical protein [Pirellulales bacterium]